MAIVHDEIPPDQLAKAQSMGSAFRKFTIEIWTLFAIALASTILRLYYRIRAVGLKGLKPDDYFVCIGIILYGAQSTMGYSIGNLAGGLANNAMTPEERAALEPGSLEYKHRVVGSKIQVAGWATYASLMLALKLSMLCFFIRLTEGLGRTYKIRIDIGFVILIVTYIVCIFTIFLGCRPFYKYWQINPDPGETCQAAVSRPIIWTSFVTNILTDIYLIMIPLPMLWGSSLRMYKKIASSIVLGAGIFVLICAILKTIYVLSDTDDSAQLAGSWGVREAFTAVMVTNLPMLFPLFKAWLRPLFGSAISSSAKTYKPDGLQTIGGSNEPTDGGKPHNRKVRVGTMGDSTGSTSNMTFDESEERIVDGNVKMQDITLSASMGTGRGQEDMDGIMISNQVQITHQDRQDEEYGGLDSRKPL